MRSTNLKEMYIVRYTDDFRIFCRTKSAAEKIKLAITQGLKERLNLEVSPDKTRVVNIKRRYSEFLGFKIKVHSKQVKALYRQAKFTVTIKYAHSNHAEKIAERLVTERGVNAQLYESDSLEWILAIEKIQEEVHDMLEKEIQQ